MDTADVDSQDAATKEGTLLHAQPTCEMLRVSAVLHPKMSCRRMRAARVPDVDVGCSMLHWKGSGKLLMVTV